MPVSCKLVERQYDYGVSKRSVDYPVSRVESDSPVDILIISDEKTGEIASSLVDLKTLSIRSTLCSQCCPICKWRICDPSDPRLDPTILPIYGTASNTLALIMVQTITINIIVAQSCLKAFVPKLCFFSKSIKRSCLGGLVVVMLKSITIPE